MPVWSRAHRKPAGWNNKDSQSERVLPIAQYNSEGALFLDFGEEVPGNSNAWADVFRFVFAGHRFACRGLRRTGAISALVTEVRLRDGTFMLAGRAKENISHVKIGVPDDTGPGAYPSGR